MNGAGGGAGRRCRPQDAFTAAYRQAKQQKAVFVAIESLGPRWAVGRRAHRTAAQHRHRGVRGGPRGCHPDPLPSDPP
ncbi:hypothetical protein C0R01_31585 [Streptomyces albidoflavus]|uniref:Uncharacterized protein n=2 Tax=Streptomyces TaxID=1883 RepID=A0AB37XC82_9ACTN|nr:unknown [Streptomyces sp. HK1]RZE37626.1 hypothetical protein C0Q91_18965 [Streptomyces albidoflavus]RZE60579.1 hypothetical protein C0R00_22690 [Streptomyces albidoflavus]RZE65946.1 hypothetical protein C0R01_31585 [Streptomyces albidoflavus]